MCSEESRFPPRHPIQMYLSLNLMKITVADSEPDPQIKE